MFIWDDSFMRKDVLQNGIMKNDIFIWFDMLSCFAKSICEMMFMKRYCENDFIKPH